MFVCACVCLLVSVYVTVRCPRCMCENSWLVCVCAGVVFREFVGVLS